MPMRPSRRETRESIDAHLSAVSLVALVFSTIATDSVFTVTSTLVMPRTTCTKPARTVSPTPIIAICSASTVPQKLTAKVFVPCVQTVARVPDRTDDDRYVLVAVPFVNTTPNVAPSVTPDMSN